MNEVDRHKSFPDKSNNTSHSSHLIWLAVVCAVLALADAFYAKPEHPHAEVENWFNFYGFFAAAVCVLLIFFASVVAPFAVSQEEKDG